MSTPTAQAASQVIADALLAITCPRGHVYADNLYIKSGGSRECKACREYRRTAEYATTKKHWVVLDDRKECRKCGAVKQATEFGIAKLGKLGRKSICKHCSRIEQATWRANNPERKWKSAIESRQRNPQRSLAVCTASRCRRRGIKCDQEYLATMPVPRVCPIFNTPISFSFGNGKQPAENAASFDRIIPECGYVRGNVQIISRLANAMKQNANPEQMLHFAEWVLREYAS